MKKTQKYFLLALLAHLLLLVPFLEFNFLSIIPQQRIYHAEEKKTTPYVPAYVFQQPQASAQNSPQKKIETSKIGTEKPQPPKAQQVNPTSPAKLISQAMVPQQQKVKSKKTFDDPLLKLLHEATTAKLVYPKISIDFNQSGVALVGFVLSPNGSVSNIKLMKSSGYELLDEAAMAAIKAISPVRHIEQFLQKPRFIAAHIAFVNNSRGGEFRMESTGD
jgi:TonB family protein